MNALENAWIELYSALVVVFILILGKHKKSEKRSSEWYFKYTMVVQLLVIGTDIILWLFEYYQKGVFILYEILWTLNFLLSIYMVLMYSLYEYTYIKENYGVEKNYPIMFFYFVFFISMGLWLSSYWNGLIFSLNRRFFPTYTNLYMFIVVMIILLTFPNYYLLYKERKKIDKRMRVYFFLYTFIPLVALALETILNINCLFYSSTCLSILMMYVGVNQKNRLIAYNQKVDVQKKENELKEIEQKVMMGNIQPLFIQSVLASIADKVTKDPKSAERITESFATYLRINLNSVGKDRPVPFEEELRHADSYLELESNIRPEKVKIVHDIQSYNFFLPVLTLQPIVENAVVHGIFPKGGGSVKLWSKEDDECFYVGVEDDGIGFDPTLVKDGIGIENTRDRIGKFCNGTLTVESAKGEGTKVTIKLPKTTNMTF